MAEDRRGLAYSSENDEAVALFDEAVDHYLEYRLDTGELLGRAVEADPGFVMPRLLKASMLRLMGSTSVASQIADELAAIDALNTPLNPREALHVEALKHWVAGDLTTARRAWDAIVQEWPFDLVALRHMHFQSFWLGEQQAMRNTVASALPAWTDDMPGYGFVLGMLAFGFEEMGDYGRAEALGREAVERNPDDLWAIHAVAHVMEMQGRLQDGIAWLDYPDDHWADRGPVKNHVWWHAALFAVESGDFDAALAVYDNHVKPGERRISTDMMNAPSLLARLELAGADVGERWEELGQWAAGWVDDHVIAFTDAHTMIPLARTGRETEAEAFVASLERFATAADNDSARRIEPYILPLARGIRAFYAGKPEQTVELIAPIRHGLLPIGGSWAQRDVFNQLLLEAAIKAGNWPLARSLASERIALRPENHLNWLKFGEMFDAAGDAEAAERVREIAEQHRPAA
jgi:tetratricopeptide (TPR) repeat protein